jgi:hypothetical protein
MLWHALILRLFRFPSGAPGDGALDIFEREPHQSAAVEKNLRRLASVTLIVTREEQCREGWNLELCALIGETVAPIVVP